VNPTDVPREHLGFEILLSPDDVVKILGLERAEQVYELIRPQARCPLPYRRIGKYLRFSPAEVRQWLEENRSAPRNRQSNGERAKRRRA
jgi:predicted DNA-binding transcriptional regulator AlpA